MRELIKKVTFKKEYESKYGTLYGFQVEYADKKAYYSSKKREQTKFVEGVDAEFTEETRTGERGEYTIIKPVFTQGSSNFARAIKREQSKYSGFAMSYAKDLVVAGKLGMRNLYMEAEMMMDWMVAKDKEQKS